MITIISSIVGLLSGALPYLVKILERRIDYKYEIELTKIKVEAATRGIELAVIAESIKADVEEGKSVRQHDSTLNYNGFLETLRASIRPLLTYFFFFLFCVVKLIAVTLMFKEGYNGIEVLKAVWDEPTTTIFAAIISFWFGNRAMIKFNDYYKTANSIQVRNK